MALEEFDPEHQAVLACALAPADLEPAALSPTFAQARSWKKVEAVARLNQLRPQVAACLVSAAGTCEEGLRLLESLEATARVHRGHAMMMAGEVLRALELLRAAGIRAVAFKGPAFAALVDGRPGQRESGDLDILVSPEDAFASVDCLLRAGYQGALPLAALRSRWLTLATNELGLELPGSPVMVELHWRLAPRWSSVAIGVEDVFDSLVPRDYLGTTISWPGPEALFLIHVVDGMKAGGCGMRWVGDLAAILRRERLDWQQVSATARRNGGLASVEIALALVEDLASEACAALRLPALAAPLPPEARSMAASARRRPRASRALHAIRKRLATDERLAGAREHFAWALRAADDPLKAAAAIAGYLAGPAVADLKSIPAEGISDFGLRLRAARRRLEAR
ncbi:MAG TPA: nucleotidyltransferase family protein [Usitatibacter sp.]|nr:nucleotidyltransferase family protein [Usitatibacter sp.]